MRSTRAQLLVTLVAALVAAGVLAHRGLPPESNIYDAVDAGDLAEARRYLAWTDPPTPGPDTDTPLHSAVMRENVEMVALLATRREYLHCCDGLGEKPMGWAMISENSAGVVAALLDAGFPVNDVADQTTGETALHKAASLAEADAVRLLVSRGADVHRRNNYGRTPLMEATGGAATALLAAGADRDARDADGNTALHCLAEILYEELWPEPDPDSPLTAVKALVEAGLDINVRNNAGETMLHVAVSSPNGVTDERLAGVVALGADLGARNARGETPLVAAIRMEMPDLSVIGKLLELGSPVETADADGLAPLHAAAQGLVMCTAISEMLIEHRARVDVRSADGRTPLMTAAATGATKNVKALLEAGADPTARDKSGWLPLHHGMVSPSPQTLHHLLREGARPFGEAVADALVRDDWDAFAKALGGDAADGGDAGGLLAEAIRRDSSLATRRDSAGWTLLHWAAVHRFTNMVDLLVDAGADVDARDPLRKLTPLMTGIKSHPGAVVSDLIRRGADLGARDADGNTPLHRAVLVGVDEAILETLIKAGADVTATNAAGQGPLDLAEYEPIAGVPWNSEAAEVLRAHGAKRAKDDAADAAPKRHQGLSRGGGGGIDTFEEGRR